MTDALGLYEGLTAGLQSVSVFLICAGSLPPPIGLSLTPTYIITMLSLIIINDNDFMTKEANVI